jgi:hypothetical protein
MKCDFPIEINGIKRIVINDVLYQRSNDNKYWLNTKTNKMLIDAHMWRRVKVLGRKERLINEVVVAPIAGERRNVSNFVPCYRVWSNMDTINVEKLYY